MDLKTIQEALPTRRLLGAIAISDDLGVILAEYDSNSMAGFVTAIVTTHTLNFNEWAHGEYFRSGLEARANFLVRAEYYYERGGEPI